MKKLIGTSTCLALSFVLTACATTSSAPAPEPAKPAYLSAAAYKEISNTAYYGKTYSEREHMFSALLARDDLSPNQRAETYLWRGTSRGVWVNDGPYASPYCAVADFETMLTMAPDHPQKAKALKDMAYQQSRYQYFTEPASCG